MNYVIYSTIYNTQSTGGTAMAGKISEKIGLDFTSPEAKNHIRRPEVINAMFGLYVQGRHRFEEIILFIEDPFFKNSLNLLYVPAPVTLLLYL